MTAGFFLISHEGYSTPQAPPQQSAGGLQVDFESVFGAKATGSNSLNSDGEEHLHISECAVLVEFGFCLLVR